MPSRSCFGHTVGDAKFSVLIGKANESHDAVRTVRVWARQPEASLDTAPARWITTWVSDSQLSEAVQAGIRRGSENGDQRADRNAQQDAATDAVHLPSR